MAHRWVYVAAGLAVFHTLLIVTGCAIQPFTYGKILVLLLALRIPAVRTSLVHLRHKWIELIGNQPAPRHPSGVITSRGVNRRLKPIDVATQAREA